MSFHPKILLGLVPVLASEFAAHWWTHPPPSENPPAVPELMAPAGSGGWTFHGHLYQKVEHSLRCTGGWIADVGEQDGPGMRVAFFRWDQARTVNTLEAFKHLPEQCMGSIGMDLENVFSRRVHESAGGTLVFDSTLFRPRGGGPSVHVFKCVWVSGFDGADLREGILMGNTGLELRRLRLAAALSRFQPTSTRVLMGAVAGMPSEDLAWHRFSSGVLGNNIVWEQPKGEVSPRP